MFRGASFRRDPAYVETPLDALAARRITDLQQRMENAERILQRQLITHGPNRDSTPETRAMYDALLEVKMALGGPFG